MSADIIQFVPRCNPNRDILARVTGVPANVATADADEQNPNQAVNAIWPARETEKEPA